MKKVSSDNTTARRMWFAVAAGFLLLATAWTVLLLVARHVRVESVPLAAQPVKP